MRSVLLPSGEVHDTNGTECQKEEGARVRTLEERTSQSERLGRHPSISRAELSHIGLKLFIEFGFDETTVEDIAAAAGIGRRTFFRYFPSKNDLPWGDFEDLLEQMRVLLASLPEDLPIIEAIRIAVVDFNRVPPEEIPFHRQRMELLLTVPSLMAHSALRYIAWRQVVAEYVAYRLDTPVESLEPQTIAWTFLGLSLSAYEQWLKNVDSNLLELMDSAFNMLNNAFTHETLL